MRTSKKAGRGGSWGGVEPGQAATAPLPAVTRYQSSAARRSVKGQLLRGFGWFLLTVLVLGAGVAGGVYLYANETIGSLNQDTNPALHKTRGLLGQLPPPGAPAVALIAGYDVRAASGNNAYAGSHSDTLMLLRADPRNHTLSLLSFPRDLSVPIYCKGNIATTQDRVNAAWADCGAANTGPYAALDTIEHLTGERFKINYLITLDFHAFKQVVNSLHGVYINVDRRYYIAPHTGTSTINLHPGYQKLNGGEALSYVRFRHFDSDVYRNGRQQLFMVALKQRLKQTLTLSNVFEIPHIIGAVKGNLAIEKSDGSSVGWGEMKTYLGLLLGLPAGHLIRNSIPQQDLTQFVTPAGADELQASPGAVAAAVDRFLHPHVPTPHHSHHVKTPKMPHSQISVLVLNGGTINGEAKHTSTLLHAAGFVTAKLPKSTPANAPSQMHDTVVYYNPSQPTAQTAAEVLAPLFGSHSVEAMTPPIAALAQQAGNPLTVVAIGTAYKGRLKLPSSGGGRSSTAGAQVQPGLGMTYAAVRSEDKPAHFPLFVPHKVAAGSSLSTDEGVRLFGPTRGRQELVLTFYQPVRLGEYWQIEESDWVSAPLFQKPTSTFVYQGRKFEEFTSGGSIQVIAVFVGHAVYWVQNTILNSLSNSTMRAIAEGLQPLHRH